MVGECIFLILKFKKYGFFFFFVKKYMVELVDIFFDFFENEGEFLDLEEEVIKYYNFGWFFFNV